MTVKFSSRVVQKMEIFYEELNFPIYYLHLRLKLFVKCLSRSYLQTSKNLLVHALKQPSQPEQEREPLPQLEVFAFDHFNLLTF